MLGGENTKFQDYAKSATTRSSQETMRRVEREFTAEQRKLIDEYASCVVKLYLEGVLKQYEHIIAGE